MMTKDEFDKLIRKLDILIKLTAANLFRGKPKTEGISLLSDLDLEPKEIAEILGTTSHYVSVQKSLAKKTEVKQEM